MSLVVAADGSVVEAPFKRKQRRAFHTADQDRELILRLAFARISEAQPPMLVAIAENCETLAGLKRYCGDIADAEAYEAIKRRAEGRLAWFRRQGAG